MLRERTVIDVRPGEDVSRTLKRLEKKFQNADLRRASPDAFDE